MYQSYFQLLSLQWGNTYSNFNYQIKVIPAVASGPFITTINDMTGLVIYLGIATLLLDYLQ